MATSILQRWLVEPAPQPPADAAARELLDRLVTATQLRFPIVGDVRGRGLMIGFELVRDPGRTPAPDPAKALEREVLKRGALISTTGAYGNVLRITPPLVIESGQVDQALGIIGDALAAVNV